MGIVDRRDKIGYIARTRNGIPIDDTGELLKRIKRGLIISNIPIPAGSYVGYLVSDGGAVHSLHTSKKSAVYEYNYTRKYYKSPKEELSVMEIYLTPDGELIDHMVIK